MTLVTYARAFLLLALPLFAVPNSLDIFEVDAALSQTNRPFSFGRVFADADAIALCPRPLVAVNGGIPTLIPSGSWQADVKTRYASGNAKFAIVSFYKTMAAGDKFTVTFTSTTCSNTALTQAQMIAFNSGGAGWGADLNVNAIPNSSFSTGFEGGTIADYCTPGTFNAGPPESCSGSNGGNVETSGVGSTTVVSTPVHSGTKSLKLQISTPNTPTSGVRMFRWLEPRTIQRGYYSVWMNIPQRYTLTGNPINGHYVNLFQFKTADGISRIDPIWALQIDDTDPSHWYLKMIWGDGGFTGAGPQSGDPVSRKEYTQAIKELPVNQWVHLEAYLEQSNAFGGRLTVWQDSVQIFDFTSIKTSYTNCAYNAWCADDEWSVNIYSDGLTPNPAYLYIDDVTIYNAGANAKEMLTALPDPAGDPECGPNYWLKGPVVTQLILQDCTSAAAYDFGFKDKKYTTLAQSMTNVATSISVLYPGDICALSLPTVIHIESEDLNVTACTASANPLTVTRAFNGTTAASHSTGLLVTATSQASALIPAPTANVTTPYTFKSLHPIYILSFYPGPNYASSTCADLYCSVKVDFILENTRNTGMQNQIYSYTLRTGAALTPVHSHPTTLTHIAYTRWRETFWSGTAPGKTRTDPNFIFLKSTGFLPNYDPSVSVAPTADYTTFAASDGGIPGGQCWNIANSTCAGLLTKAMASNNEGAPIQREDLNYLYNASSCSIANSVCAKAWYILTGEKGAIDTLIAPNLCTTQTGCRYGGVWDAAQSAGYYVREGRSGAAAPNAFYSSTRADKDAAGDTAATAAAAGNLVTGRAHSRHAFSEQYNAGNSPGSGCRGGSSGTNLLVPVGCSTTNGWTTGFNDIPSHLLDYNWVPYLLTGDYYYLEAEYFSASVSLYTFNAGNNAVGSNNFFAYITPSLSVPRNFAWGMQAVSRAAWMAPDGTKEKDYYTAQVSSNLEVQEGFAAVTGTTLSPADTTCAAYSATTANRWCWGRKTVGEDKVVKNYAPAAGNCVTTSLYVDVTKSKAVESSYPVHMFAIAINEISEIGFTQADPLRDHYNKRITEMVMDSTFNPYLVASYNHGVKDASTACVNTSTTPPYLANWAAVKDAFVLALQTANNFCDANQTCNSTVNPGTPPWTVFRCTDHAYSLLARAAGAYASQSAASTTNANCPSGVCLGVTAYTWLDAQVPYFSKPTAVSGTCGTSDAQIKYAIIPRTIPLTSGMKGFVIITGEGVIGR